MMQDVEPAIFNRIFKQLQKVHGVLLSMAKQNSKSLDNDQIQLLNKFEISNPSRFKTIYMTDMMNIITEYANNGDKQYEDLLSCIKIYQENANAQKKIGSNLNSIFISNVNAILNNYMKSLYEKKVVKSTPFNFSFILKSSSPKELFKIFVMEALIWQAKGAQKPKVIDFYLSDSKLYKKINKVNNNIYKIEEKFDNTNGKIEDLEKRFDEKYENLEEKIDQLSKNFNNIFTNLKNELIETKKDISNINISVSQISRALFQNIRQNQRRSNLICTYVDDIRSSSENFISAMNAV